MPEINNAWPERIEPASRHLGGEAALYECRQQMMTGGNVEIGPVGQFGQRRFAPGLSDRFQQEKGAIDGLNIVPVAPARAWRTGLGAGSRQNGGIHLFFSPSMQGKSDDGTESRSFQIKERHF